MTNGFVRLWCCLACWCPVAKRKDWEVIKLLAETEAPSELNYYMSLPFIDVGRIPGPAPDEKINRSWDCEKLLFEEAVYFSELTGVYRDSDGARCVMIVKRMGEGWWRVRDIILGEGHQVVIESAGWRRQDHGMIMPEAYDKRSEASTRWSIDNACLHMRHLARMPGNLVKMEPQLSRAARKLNEKTIKKKPWARNDLSTYIVIEPGKEAEYGQPKTTTGDGRAMTPHRRRGHWMAMRSERYKEGKRGQRVWRRPAWVGPREWVHQGREYRVISEVANG